MIVKFYLNSKYFLFYYVYRINEIFKKKDRLLIYFFIDVIYRLITHLKFSFNFYKLPELKDESVIHTRQFHKDNYEIYLTIKYGKSLEEIIEFSNLRMLSFEFIKAPSLIDNDVIKINCGECNYLLKIINKKSSKYFNDEFEKSKFISNYSSSFSSVHIPSLLYNHESKDFKVLIYNHFDSIPFSPSKHSVDNVVMFITRLQQIKDEITNLEIKFEVDNSMSLLTQKISILRFSYRNCPKDLLETFQGKIEALYISIIDESNSIHTDTEPVLIHGDLNFHNILGFKDHILIIIDWESLKLGSKYFDISYFLSFFNSKELFDEYYKLPNKFKYNLYFVWLLIFQHTKNHSTKVNYNLLISILETLKNEHRF